jgi:nitrite reductase/ring-hydroxylating ferredoxin subunit
MVQRRGETARLWGELPHVSDTILCELSLGELRREGSLSREIDGVEILIVDTPDGVRAFSGVCPHLGGPLTRESVRGDRIRCPWHRYEFALSDGRCLTVAGHPWRNLPGRRETEPRRLRLRPLRFEIIGENVCVLHPGVE